MRISGITISDKKKLDVGLTALFGVGRSRAREILKKAKVDHSGKTGDLSATEESAIKKIIEEYKLEGDLKRNVSGNIKRLIDIKAYRGSRHTKNLPCRGQRTRTNARTLRGAKKTMGSGRKKETK